MPKTHLSHPLGRLGRFLDAFWEVLGGSWRPFGPPFGVHFGFLDGFLEVLFVGALRLDFGRFFDAIL